MLHRTSKIGKLGTLAVVALMMFAAVACQKGKGGAGKLEAVAGEAFSTLPKDTGLVVGINADKLKESKVWEKYGKMAIDSKKEDLDKLKADCGIDFVGGLKNILITDDAKFDGKKFLIAVNGKWDKAKVNTCIQKVAQEKQNKKVTITDEGKLTKYETEGEKPIYTAWLGNETVLISPNSEGDKAYLESVVAHTSSIKDNAALLDLINQVDTKELLWGAMIAPKEGEGSQMFNGLELAEKPEAAFFDLHFAKDLKGKVGFRFATEAGAKAMTEKFTGEINSQKQNPMFGKYLTDLKIATNGKDSVITLALNPQQVDELMAMVEQQLGMFLPMLLGGAMGGGGM